MKVIKPKSAPDSPYKLLIWDTAGAERLTMRNFTRNFFKRAHGIIICFDLSDLDSFESVPRWINGIREICETDIPLLLIGNKSDLRDCRGVLREEAEQLADEHNMVYIETSARDNINLDMAFAEIAD